MEKNIQKVDVDIDHCYKSYSSKNPEKNVSWFSKKKQHNCFQHDINNVPKHQIAFDSEGILWHWRLD